MNLYRLDYVDTPEIGITDPNCPWLPFLTRSAQRAREVALATAEIDFERVAITRISGAGAMKRMHIAMPDGTVKRAAA